MKSHISTIASVIKGVLALSAFAVVSLRGEGLSDSAARQIQALQAEKASLSAAQQKIDSHLVLGAKQARGLQIGGGAVPNLHVRSTADANGNVTVDISCTPTPALLQVISAVGGKTLDSLPNYNSVRAVLPLLQVETVAARPEVTFIRPALRPILNNSDPDGVAAEGADVARSHFGADGSGVKVGVMSDSSDYLGYAQSLGDLGPVIVLPGQSGVPGTGEGTAMLEIVHAMAPGAQLFFASGDGGDARFAQNIHDLRFVYGCDIIVDDLSEGDGSPFQDDVIAKAVNEVSADGCLYFSSAANSGNLDSGTSGTWEGDYVDGGPVASPLTKGNLHAFGGGTNYDTIVNAGEGFPVILFWSDPLGASTNDYDLYILDPTGAQVVDFSINPQTGSQDPWEFAQPTNVGELIVIVRNTNAAPRFLHLDGDRATLSIGTAGSTRGHNAAAATVDVAATWAGNSAPSPFSGGSVNPVEEFSSDGPRRIFFAPNGTPITPGDFSSTGGKVLLKPDITAADGVITTVPGFDPFFGTSAAAPHAASIAALLKSYNPSLTASNIYTIMTQTALKISGLGYGVLARGVDRDSGYGIVMPGPALAATSRQPVHLGIATNIIGGVTGPGISPNECVQLTVVLTNFNPTSITSVQGILSSSDFPDVIITVPVVSYPNIQGYSTNSAAIPFTLSIGPNFPCGQTAPLTLTVKCDQGVEALPVILPSGVVSAPVLFENPPPAPISIPGASGLLWPVDVSGLGSVKSLTVNTFITAGEDSGITMELMSPNGTSVTLVSAGRESGADFGSGCSRGAATTFDDAAVTPISQGAAPFVGSFAPEGVLGTFDGLSGSALNGTWWLHITDRNAADFSALNCWSLSVTPWTCSAGTGPCAGSDLSISIAASPNPSVVGSNFVCTLVASNAGPGVATGVAVQQTFDAFSKFVTASNLSQGSVSASIGGALWTVGDLPIGAIATASMVAFPTSSALTSNVETVTTAAISSSTVDPNLANNTATAAVTISPPRADAGVTMTALPNPALQNGALTYSMVVTNYGPSAADGVVLTMLIPNVQVLSGSLQTVLGTLPVHGGAVVNIVVSPKVTGSITATASVSISGSQFDPFPANNSATVSTTINSSSDLGLSAFETPNPSVVGSNLVYVATITNRGPANATGVTLTHNFPLGSRFVSTTAASQTYSTNAGSLFWSLGSLSNGASASITNILSAPTNPGAFSSALSVVGQPADPNTNDNVVILSTFNSNAFVRIIPAGAVLHSSRQPGAISANDAVNIDLALQNAGNIPTGNLLVTLLATNGVISPNPSGPIPYGPNGKLANGAIVSSNFTFSTTSSYTGTITLGLHDGLTDLGTVSFFYPLPTASVFSNSAYISIPDQKFIPQPDSGAANPYPSTISVSNVAGVVSTVSVSFWNMSHTYPHDVSMLLVSPAGLRSIIMAGAASNSQMASVNFTLDPRTNFPVLPSNSVIVAGTYRPTNFNSTNFFPNAPVGPYQSGLGIFSGLASTVNGPWSLYVTDNSDGDSGNIAQGWSIAFEAITPVNQLADLGVSAAAGNGQVIIGGTNTFTVTVTNGGPNPCGAILTNILPSGLAFVSASLPQSAYSVNGQSVIYNLGVIQPGGSVTFTTAASASSLGQQLDSFIVGPALPTIYDPVAANNIATPITTVVAPSADVVALISLASATGVVGHNVNYTLTVSNAGPQVAQNPAGSFDFTGLALSSNTSFGTISGNVLNVAFTNMPPSSAQVVTVTAAPLVAGLLTNTWTVATSSANDNPANDSASAVLAVSNALPRIVAGPAILLTPGIFGSIGSNMTATVSLVLSNIGYSSTANLGATLQAAPGLIPTTTSNYYGAIPANGATNRSFTFTLRGGPGATIFATLALQDGAIAYPSVSFAFTLPNGFTVSNGAAIVIPDFGPASPYPSVIPVNTNGVVSKVTVTLRGYTHSFPRDVNALLVGPNGQQAMLMSHAGGPYSVSGLNLTFDDSSTNFLPTTALASGNFSGTEFSPFAVLPGFQSPVYNTSLSVFNGTSPNGPWQLYVDDDFQGNDGAVNQGWALNFSLVSPVNPAAALGLGLNHSPASAYVDNLVTCVFDVTNSGPGDAASVLSTNTFPGSVIIVGATASQGSVLQVSGGQVICNLGTIPAGSVATITVTVIPTQPGSLTYSGIASPATVNPFAPALTPIGDVVNVLPLTTGLWSATNSGGNVQLTLSAQGNQIYIVQRSTDLVSWTSISTNFTAPDGSFTITDKATNSLRFYRAFHMPQ